MVGITVCQKKPQSKRWIAIDGYIRPAATIATDTIVLDLWGLWGMSELNNEHEPFTEGVVVSRCL